MDAFSKNIFSSDSCGFIDERNREIHEALLGFQNNIKEDFDSSSDCIGNTDKHNSSVPRLNIEIKVIEDPCLSNDDVEFERCQFDCCDCNCANFNNSTDINNLDFVWNYIRKIAGYSESLLVALFGCSDINNILLKYNASTVINKIDKFEKACGNIPNI